MRNDTSPLGPPVTCMLIFRPWIAGGTGGLTSAWIFSAWVNQPSDRNCSATGVSFGCRGWIRARLSTRVARSFKRWRSPELRGRVLEQAAGDDQLVDLLGSFIDVVDLRVAHPLLDQELLRITHGSEQLDRLLRDLGDRETGLG